MPWVFLFTEFLILFITSKYLFNSIFLLLYKIFRSQRLSIFIVSAFFFPGVLLHELSHMIVAEVLLVKTHGMEFVPVLRDGSLKMGSVLLEKSDILRSLLIGVAPLIVGSSVLAGSLWYLSRIFSYQDVFRSPFSLVLTFIIGVLVFIISNTMFSSKKDIEGLFEFAIVASILVGGLYFAGIRIHEIILPLMLKEGVLKAVGGISFFLLVPVFINTFIVLLSFLTRKSRG